MTSEREPQSRPAADGLVPPELEKPRTWIFPLFFLVVLIVPVAILVLSNTDSQEIGFAGLTWEAPLWVILAITFIAGAVLTRLAGWGWGAVRRRGRRKRAEYDQARRQAQTG